MVDAGAGINYGKVLLGGVVAGLIINISEFVLNGVILVNEYVAAMEGLGLEEPGWAMTGYVVAAFVHGFVLAWLYAAIRPRFGPGWRTGVIAGVVLWVAAYLVPTVWFGAMGLTMGTGVTLLVLAWGLVELAIAGLAGGWLYQEGAVTAARAEPGTPMGPPTM